MRKIISLILICLLFICVPAVVFAEDDSTAGSMNKNSMEFTGEEIGLSLDDAKKMMLTSGTDFLTAEMNMKANKAQNRSYSENIARIWMGNAPSKTLIEMTDYAYDFTKAQIKLNYDAEINKIVRDVIENYYKLANAKEALRISNDNVTVQEKLYQNTQSKFKLGVVSKQDVLKAEIGLNDAKVKAETAENMYINARMGFNIKFGYDLMQNIIITDTLEEAPISDISLNDAINSALSNRNEIRRAAFNLKMSELSLRETGNTISSSSAKYLEAAARLMGAQTASEVAPKTVEMDVRSKYLNMTQKKSEIELGKLSVSNAKETYRLANLQYDAGMATLTDTQQAQLGAYQAELAYYSTLLEYNLAIIDYEQSTTVGTATVTF